MVQEMDPSKEHQQNPDPFGEYLSPIPTSIYTRDGYVVDTSGLVWRTPPQFGSRKLDWTKVQSTPAMLRVLMGYIAAKMKGRSEGYAVNEFTRLAAVKDFSLLTCPWEQNGEIVLADLLRVMRHLEMSYPKVWGCYFEAVRRLFRWAAGKGIPGFTLETCDDLERAKVKKRIPLVVRLNVAPGAPRSKAAKNRRVYSEIDLTLITAYFFRAEAILRSGQALYRRVDPNSKWAKEGRHGVVRMHGELMCPSTVDYSNLTLGWLALRFGDRPDAFRKLRESHFEFIQEGEVTLAQIRMPESKIRHSDHKAAHGPLPLGDDLARLVPDVIARNRAIRERLGLDNNLDWPLFMVAQDGKGSWVRKRSALPHDDPTKSAEKSTITLIYDLQNLFRVLQVPDGEGGVIVPTYYSFRDGIVTNWILSGKDPAVMAELHGKQLRSLQPYNAPGVRFVERLDTVPELKQLADAFSPNDPLRQAEVDQQELIQEPFVEIDDEHSVIGFTGRCGCIGAPSCPITMNGSVDCYLCPGFQAIVEGPHKKVFATLWARREAMIRRGLPEREYKRYDRQLAACGAVITKIEYMAEAAG